MLSFLDPRLWGAFILGIALAFAGGYFKGNHDGAKHVRLEWDAAVSRANSESRHLEQERQRRVDDVRIGCVLMLLVLALMLTGCAATSAPSSEPARNPSPPPTRLSPSPPNYSQRAASDIQTWRQKLTEQTSKLENSGKPGPSR